MSNLRVLILTQNYPPEPDTIIHNLAKTLISRGYGVTVLTGFPNYPQGIIYDGYHQKLVMREHFDGVEVIRLPLYPDRSRSVLKRSLNYISFPAVASLFGPFVCNCNDVMIVRHPPITIGIPGSLISRIRKIPFILEIQDMWPETLHATDMVQNPFSLGIIQKIAMLIYSQASAISVISPGFKRNLVEKGVPEKKIHLIYNSAYEGDYSLPAYAPDIAVKFCLRGKFNIVYAGNIGPAQGLSNVLKAASMLRDLPDVQFVLIGSGIDQPLLEKEATDKGLNNIRFLCRQPMSMMPLFYSLCDAVMVHLKDDPLFEITIPGKTQSCLLTGKPIIAAVNGDVAELITKAGAGFAVRAMDPEDLARAVRALYSMSSGERKAMGAAGRSFYFKHMSPEVQADRYCQLFEQVLSGR